MYWTIAQAVVLLQDLEDHELRAGYNVFIGGSEPLGCPGQAHAVQEVVAMTPYF